MDVFLYVSWMSKNTSKKFYIFAWNNKLGITNYTKCWYLFRYFRDINLVLKLPVNVIMFLRHPSNIQLLLLKNIVWSSDSFKFCNRHGKTSFECFKNVSEKNHCVFTAVEYKYCKLSLSGTLNKNGTVFLDPIALNLTKKWTNVLVPWQFQIARVNCRKNTLSPVLHLSYSY